MSKTIFEFQTKIREFVLKCFGPAIAYNKLERSYRVLEESLELVQAGGMTKEEALKMVDYTFSRPIGKVNSEVGGVMTTLAAFCNAYDINLEFESFFELARIDTPEMIEKIRTKQDLKPHGSDDGNYVKFT